MAANKSIQENEIITIGLSPQKDNVWGDYARTLIVEKYLHKTLIDVATRNMTFEELYYNMNDLIVKNKNDRVYIEKGNFSILNFKYGYKREDIY